MEVYLVGGAVRDMLLGHAPKDRDYVVVGSSTEEMLSLGYKQVGADFPVFLHPITGAEYALARTERKTGTGYNGFTVDASPTVTLVEDLSRRDLTINAMAMDPSGKIIDPFNGKKDLERGILRHVSDAFSEDPVRVIRLARFAAKFSFVVAPETIKLAVGMVSSGLLNDLTAERVWAELSKALVISTPSEFFMWLNVFGALEVLFPEIHALSGVPQNETHHPEIDTFVHTMMAINRGRKLNADLPTMVAILLHDLGKALTPEDELPRHVNHEDTGVPLVATFCKRLRIPNETRRLAENVCRYHLKSHRLLDMRPGRIWNLLESINAVRNPIKLEQFLTACQADAQGRLGLEDKPYPQAEMLRWAYPIARRVTISEEARSTKTGLEIGYAIKQARIQELNRLIAQFKRQQAIG